MFNKSSTRRTNINNRIGHYNAERFDSTLGLYGADETVGILITVDETFDNDHRVVNQRGANKGRFTFSAADSGDHKICFHPTGSGVSGGWLSSGALGHAIKFTLDLAIGETSSIESTDKGHIDDIVKKVQDLNGRLQDIRREQVFQRVSCAPFYEPKLIHMNIIRTDLSNLGARG